MKNKWLVFGYEDEFGYVGSFWEVAIRPKLCWLLGHKAYPYGRETLKQLKKDKDKFFCGKCSKHVRFPLWFRIINSR